MTFKKSYKAIQKAIVGRKKKEITLKQLKSKRIKELTEEVRRMREAKIQERRTTILSKIEDKIPRVFGQKKEPLKRQTFLGRV